MAYKCVVGLGNPGSKYELTRHNLGFMVVDELARKWNLQWQSSKFKALIAQDSSVIFAKPQTYMNNSGLSVGPLAGYKNILPEDILVVYDELDLPLGKMRIRPKGSPGTHNGMRSITEVVGLDVMRLRIGIGPPAPHMSLAHFVLKPFVPEEVIVIRDMITLAVQAVETWLKHGVEKAMCEYNG